MSPMSSALLLIALTMTIPSALSVTPTSVCTVNQECSSNFCCLLTPIRYAVPSCRPVLQEGERCRVNAETVTANLTYPDNSRLEVKDIHYILCPCADGLSCDAKKGGICIY